VTPDAVLDPALQLALRGSLALLLLVAAAHKATDAGAFREALAGYALLPRGVVPFAAASFMTIEASLAIGLLWPLLAPEAALLTAGLFFLYGAAIAINLARGRRHIDCGCAGPAGRQPLSPGLVVRNAALVLMALAATTPAGVRTLVWIDAVTVVAFVLAAALVYAAADAALAQAARLSLARGEPWSKP
jgi:hypothetical protein